MEKLTVTLDAVKTTIPVECNPNVYNRIMNGGVIGTIIIDKDYNCIQGVNVLNTTIYLYNSGVIVTPYIDVILFILK